MQNGMKRRGLLAAAGAAFVGTTAVHIARGGDVQKPEASAEPAAKAPAKQAEAAKLPAPEGVLGLSAGGYRVTEVSPIQFGGFALTLTGEKGDSFTVDVCARGEGHTGVARTASLELYLRNDGQGDTPTHEAHGLATMALAGSLSRVEASINTTAMLPLATRLKVYGPEISRGLA